MEEVPIAPADAKTLERFVRGTLGCRCPDEIFSDVVITHERNPGSGLTYTRLVLGNRLLVYVTDARHSKTLNEDVATLAMCGCADRDSNDFNRFRLVLTADRRGESHAEVDTVFSGAAGHDDHAHLHVIAAADIPSPLRAP